MILYWASSQGAKHQYNYTGRERETGHHRPENVRAATRVRLRLTERSCPSLAPRLTTVALSSDPSTSYCPLTPRLATVALTPDPSTSYCRSVL
ncbi:hypothetical protein ACOMHN_042872 [Nucella lapillus]